MPKALSNWLPHLRLTWQKNSGKLLQQQVSQSLYVAWPTWDESKLVEDEIEIVVQIKGKVRAKLMVAKDLSREELQEVALADEKVKAEIDGKEIVKVIAVPNKLVNIVVK